MVQAVLKINQSLQLSSQADNSIIEKNTHKIKKTNVDLIRNLDSLMHKFFFVLNLMQPTKLISCS